MVVPRNSNGVPLSAMHLAQHAAKLNPTNVPPQSAIHALHFALAKSGLSAPAAAAADDASDAILPHDPQFSTVVVPEALAIMTQKYWGTDGVRLTVGFIDVAPYPSLRLQAKIVAYMNKWSQYCNAAFMLTRGNPQAADVRVSLLGEKKRNGVVVKEGGYWSYIGTDIWSIARDEPTMNLQGFSLDTPDIEYARVVIHETGHTLGFPHEHMRTEIVDGIDVEKAVAHFLQTDGWSRETTIQQVLTPLNPASIRATEKADTQSIMCYSLPAEIMKNGIGVPGGTVIDTLDASFAASQYPRIGTSRGARSAAIQSVPTVSEEDDEVSVQEWARASREREEEKSWTSSSLLPANGSTFTNTMSRAFAASVTEDEFPNADDGTDSLDHQAHIMGDLESYQERATESLAKLVPAVPVQLFMSVSRDVSSSDDITTNLKFVKYDGYQNVPSHVGTPLPASEHANAQRYCTQAKVIIKYGLDGLLARATLLLKTWNEPQNYDQVFTRWLNVFPEPRCLQPKRTAWEDDAVWAQRFLSGPNAVMIQRVEQTNNQVLLHAYGIDDVAVLNPFASTGRRPNHATLSLFQVDYSALTGINPLKGWFLCAPRALFASVDGILFPLAMSIPNPNVSTTRTVVNNVAAPVWQLAKMIVGNADANYHEVVTHLGFTHLLMEPIAIATKLSLAAHPGHRIMQMLCPHFHNTMFVNNVGRSTLIAHDALFSLDAVTSIGVDGGKILLNNMFADPFDFLAETSLPRKLRARGFDDSLPHALNGTAYDGIRNYYYRDDGLRIWNCLQRYVTACLSECYPTNPALQSDQVLRTWADMCREPSHGNIPSFPIFTSREVLIETLTAIIWTASAQHAAVNFNQYDSYGFAPNAPLILRRGFPKDLSTIDADYITQSLVPVANLLETLNLAKVLTIDDHAAEPYLLELESWATDGIVAFPNQYRDLVSDLKQAEQAMDAILHSRVAKYDYLFPSKIPASIAV